MENREKSPGRTGDGPSRELGERLEVAVRAARQQRDGSERAASDPVGETRGSCADAVVGSTGHATRIAGAQTGRANRQVA
ncbi:MAG: hypothetical protein ACPHGW_00275 [Pseudohongiellaceae bacterium]